MFRSLRSRLILASLLWTGGLLLVMHVFSILVLHVIPSVRLQHAPLPVAAGLFAMAAGLVALRQSLAPFRRLREKLLCVRGGAGRRIEGQYATEVQPLIDDLNALLEDREKAVQRALRTAADLAHGLKTPLALLAQEADRAAASGFPEMAVSIGQQAERMSRQINYHLARARAAASGASGRARCQLAPCADALVRTMAKLHAERALTINYTGPPDLVARVQREDLDEILGNLLDNACKWAKSKVVLHATERDDVLSILVDDDGPGLAPDQHSAALEPGVRMDEAAPGSGFGLAIVRDLVELYGGSIRLEKSSLGGLRARITFPTGSASPAATRPGIAQFIEEGVPSQGCGAIVEGSPPRVRKAISDRARSCVVQFRTSETFAMPGQHCLRLDDHQPLVQARPNTLHRDPESPVCNS